MASVPAASAVRAAISLVLAVIPQLRAAGVVADRDWLGKAFASLRPFGGIACLPIAAGERSAFRAAVAAGLILRELRLEAASLEDLFARATSAGGEGPA